MRVTWQQIAAAQPDVILLIPCCYSQTQTQEMWDALPKPAEWSQIPAAQTGRVYALDANYYALLLCNAQKVRLIKTLDGDTVLVEVDYAWQLGRPYDLQRQVEGYRLSATINGQKLLDAVDDKRPLTGGGVALVCEEGRTATQAVKVRPL